MSLASQTQAGFTRVGQEIKSVRSSLPPLATRTLTLCNGGQSGYPIKSNLSLSQFGFRQVVRLPVTTSRWRVRAGNFDSAAVDGVAKVALTGNGIVTGKHAGYDGSGNPTFNFSGGSATSIQSGTFTIPGDGSFYESAWVTSPSLQIEAGVEQLVAVGVTCPGSTSIMITTGEVGLFSTSASALNPATTTGATSSYIPMDWQIEYESTSGRSAWLFVGDSITEGVQGPQGTSSSTIYPNPLFNSYPNRWAAQENALVQNISMAGLRADHYASYNRIWSRTNMSDGQWSGAVIALGSNDAAAGKTLSQYQAAISTVVDKVRAVIGSSAPIYFGNVMPRGGVTGSNNTNRIAYNNWLAGLPFGAAGLIDFDERLRSSSTVLLAENSCDGIHPSYTGVARMVERIRQNSPTPA